jgi:Lysyl oxidase
MHEGTRRIVVASALALLLAGAASAQPLPDLRALIDEEFIPIEIQRDVNVPLADVAEGCAGGATNRTLLRFTLSTFNDGTADVVLGDPGCPPCFGEPPPVCANPLFECSVAEGHHHAHFKKYALYELLPSAAAPPAAIGHKQGFCIEDTICGHRKYDCTNQGLSVGCHDAYFNFLGCQYIDITGVPGGRYLLRASVNFEHIIAESNFDNNVDVKPIELCDALTAPSIRVTKRGKHGRWLATGHVVLAKAPLVEPDPLADGALLRLALDGTSLVDVAIPGGAHGTGCKKGDGWRRGARGKRWTYANTSGFLDLTCGVSADGLRRLVLQRTTDGFSYAARGVLATDASLTPTSGAATVVMGEVTGPCGTGALSACAALKRGSGATCTGSASGAFLDPALE